MVNRALSAAFVFVIAGCGDGLGAELKLNLVVYDSCTQFPLQSDQLSSLEVVVESSQMASPVRQSFQFGTRRGGIDGIEPVDDAVVSVLARSTLGGTTQVRAAASVGLIDLTGSDGREVVEISMVIGETDSFIATTNASLANECTTQVVARRGHTATLLPDGRVLLAGGADNNAVSSRLWTTTEIFNPRTGFFIAGPEMRNGRQGHRATRLADGKVLISGGEGEPTVGTLRSAQVFNVDTGTFGAPISMREARAYHSAIQMDDGRVLLAGGAFRDNAGSLQYLDTTEFYDPATGQFMAGPLLPEARGFHSAVKIGPTTIALVGGLNRDGLVAQIQFVNPAGVIPGPSLSTPRSHLAAAMVPDRDAIFVGGGFSTLANDPARPETTPGSARFEIVELDTANFSNSQMLCPAGQLRSARGDVAISPVPGGLLLSGGVSGTNEVAASAERIIFSDAADLCSPTPSSNEPSIFTGESLQRARAGHRATPLLGGDILVTGGYSLDTAIAVSERVAESVRDTEVYIIER